MEAPQALEKWSTPDILPVRARAGRAFCLHKRGGGISDSSR
jgi:hypothetical protein